MHCHLQFAKCLKRFLIAGTADLHQELAQSPGQASENSVGSWHEAINQHASRFANLRGTGYSMLFDSDDFDSDEEC